MIGKAKPACRNGVDRGKEPRRREHERRALLDGSDGYAPACCLTQNTPSRKVDFGANGHPLSTGTYSEVSLEQQISLLKSLGLRTYRVNVNPSYPDKFDRLSELISLAQHENIRILLVLVLPARQYSGESAAYRDSEAKVFRLARQFDTRVTAWELGNEYDL